MEQIEAVESFLSIPEPDPALRNEPGGDANQMPGINHQYCTRNACIRL